MVIEQFLMPLARCKQSFFQTDCFPSWSKLLKQNVPRTEKAETHKSMAFDFKADYITYL